MNTAEAIALLNEISEHASWWIASAAPADERESVRRDIRAQLWQAEKAFYDAGFAAAAALHAEVSSSPQPL